jgi:hypothetical protein
MGSFVHCGVRLGYERLYKKCLLFTHSQTSSGAHMGTMGFFQAIKRPGLEADHSPPSKGPHTLLS